MDEMSDNGVGWSRGESGGVGWMGWGGVCHNGIGLAEMG